ncbi:nucleoside 2-deoxyribosyltransferase [Bradyrhizobium cosmicum]|uniref:nucleoside 2-deoxyribosyltransferase n=1 Tax=Bradyrhizobium cosmicum TaxID=1404864 RepID=UPI00116483FA|nr:nucleoside 2-deoxyribosyltransferase [Bradyrhizobium cosmicum]QDP23947.1 nucleoside 2-deoxyribosyltransferase [Bradyrhizobium cosmicum]
MRAYFAAPLFNAMERRHNLEIVEHIEAWLKVFLPQRDGGLLTKLVNEGMPVDAAERLVFETDLRAIAAADVVVTVLDGAHIDEGVAFEVGFAYALGKPCVGLQTDARRQLPTGNNPMLSKSLTAVFQAEHDLYNWLQDFAAGRTTRTDRFELMSHQLYGQPTAD